MLTPASAPRCAGDAGAPPGLRDLRGRQVECRHCGLYALCLPVGVGRADLELLDRVIKRRRAVPAARRLFQRGERFGSVFAVKSGSFKTVVPLEGSRVQVVGFQLPGDLIGLDAVGPGTYQYDACAIESSSVCEIPFESLEDLGMMVQRMQRQMLRIMSHQIRHDLMLQVMHCSRSAEQRLAGFLLNLSARFEARGFSALEFKLAMSRDDLANYLGLAKATVCRQLTAMQERGLLELSRKHVRIGRRDELLALAGGDWTPA